MGRGRQYRAKVARRVRNERELKIIYKIYPDLKRQEQSSSPSERLIAMGTRVSQGVSFGWRESERRINLKNIAERRKRRNKLRSMRVRSKTMINIERADLAEIERTNRIHAVWRSRIAAKRQDIDEECRHIPRRINTPYNETSSLERTTSL